MDRSRKAHRQRSLEGIAACKFIGTTPLADLRRMSLFEANPRPMPAEPVTRDTAATPSLRPRARFRPYPWPPKRFSWWARTKARVAKLFRTLTRRRDHG